MTETERTDQPIENTEETAAPQETQPAEPSAPAIDPVQFLAQLKEQQLPEADAALKALVTEHAEDALPALALAAQQGGLALAAKAIEALAALRTQEAADVLAAIGVDRSDAPKAKEARRALHKLSLAGIKPEQVAAPPAAEPEPDKVYACLASPIDGEGTHTVTIVRQNKFGTLGMAVFMLNEKLGVVDAYGAVPCSMSLWKRYLADAEAGEHKLTPVELSFCQQQLETAAERSRRSKSRLPDHYYNFASLAIGASEDRKRPVELSADAAADPGLLAKSADLFSLPECKTWLLPYEDIRPHALKMISEARRLGQDPNQPREVMDLGKVQREGAVISMAMNALFDGARRAAYQERLEYTADLLWRADRLEEAKWAMAAALALAPESTLPVDQHPFLREVTQQTMLLAVQAEEAGLTPEMAREGAGKGAVEKKAGPEEYVDAEGNIRRKSGLILPR